MQWFHHFFLTWMQFILDWGYLGIFIMMTFESTALPIPAEIVMPPAAYWASQGHFNFTLVILAIIAISVLPIVIEALRARRRRPA